MEQSSPTVSSSPPFFCGSPPSRVANPLIQDARFGDENFSPLSSSSWVVVPSPSGLPPSPSSSARKGGCVRANFGNNPAVRVEGFDCLDRDRRNCSIPALAQNNNNNTYMIRAQLTTQFITATEGIFGLFESDEEKMKFTVNMFS